MKIKYVTIVILAILSGSCGKDFLDIPSKTTLSNTLFFKTEADFVSAINGAYAPLRDLYNGYSSAQYLGAYIMGEMHSDNARYILNPNYRATTDAENIADFVYLSSSAIATQKYQTNYQVISRANQVLYYIDKVSFEANSQNNIKGQALFLRALSYFELVQYYGSVPLHLVPASSLSETALPLSSVDEVTTQVITDALAAIDLLPTKSVQEAGRATKGAAQMLLANVYMVQKKWDEAETLLKEIVNSGSYTLNGDYASVFSTANKNNSESVFEIQYRQGTDGYASFFIYNMLPYPMAKDTLAFLTKVGNPNSLTEGEGYNIPTPDLISAYESGDVRFKASIGYTHDQDGTKFPYVKKYLHEHALFQKSDDNWPVYRYSEVLLFLAEAINEQGGRSTDALSFLNQVRNRVKLADETQTNQALLRDIILHERRVELAFENKRWLDLVRAGKAVEVISAYGAKVKAYPHDYYFPHGYTPVPSAFSDIQLLFPLPASEALLSPYF